MGKTKILTDDDVTVEKPVVQIPAPDLDIVERGMQNVFGFQSEAIALHDPRFQTHWVNTAIRENRFSEMTRAGYLPVRPEYLKDHRSVHFSVSADGFVTRGARGEEVLMYTLKDVVRNRAMEKARKNQAGMRSSQMKAEVVNAAGNQLGDEAADFLQRRGSVVGGVRDSYERIEKRDEAE